MNSNAFHISNVLLKSIFILLAFMVTNTADGQDFLLFKKGKSYHYQGNSYKLGELGKIYSDYQPSLAQYQKGYKHRKMANFLLAGGLASMGLGFGLVVVLPNFDLVYGGGSFVLAGLLAEFVAIGFAISGNRKLKRAMEGFNYEMIRRNGYQSEVILNIGLTGNGLGVSMRF